MNIAEKYVQRYTTMSNLIGWFKYFQIELTFGDGDGPNICREKKSRH